MGMAPWQLGRGVVGGFSKPRLIGSGVPSDSLGELGNYYYDSSANRWYLKRWVANPKGLDTITVMAPSFVVAEAHSVELLFRVQGGYVASQFKPRLYRCLTSSAQPVEHFLLNGPTPMHEVYAEVCSDTSGNTNLICGKVVTDGSWHKYRIQRIGDVFATYTDGVLSQQKTLSGWTCGTYVPDRMVFGDAYGIPAGQTGLQIANIVVTNTSAPRCTLRLDEGSGTVAYDTSGAGNNGTIADNTPATFWQAAWVPMDLLA